MSVIEHDKESSPLRGWTIDRKINIFGTIGIMLAMASWVWALSDRVASNTRAIASNQTIMELQINQINISLREIALNQRLGHPVSASRFADIQAQLLRIEDKVDRHFDPQKHD